MKRKPPPAKPVPVATICRWAAYGPLALFEAEREAEALRAENERLRARVDELERGRPVQRTLFE
jgi:cell division protein FtsB